MKKSSALMLSYIVILILTIYAAVCSEWNGIEQVALAATVAGLFFALADLCGGGESSNRPMVDARKKHLNEYKVFLNEIYECTTKDEDDYNKAVGLLEPYRNSHKDVAEAISGLEETIKAISSVKDKANEDLAKLPKKMKAVARLEVEIKILKWMDVFFTAMGFLAFFLLVIFDTFFDLIMPRGAIITVFAFAIIMCTYYIKDLFEEKGWEAVEKTAKNTQKMKEKLEQFKAVRNTNSEFEDAQKLAATLSKYPNKEDIANK